MQRLPLEPDELKALAGRPALPPSGVHAPAAVPSLLRLHSRSRLVCVKLPFCPLLASP